MPLLWQAVTNVWNFSVTLRKLVCRRPFDILHPLAPMPPPAGNSTGGSVWLGTARAAQSDGLPGVVLPGAGETKQETLGVTK